MPEARGSAVSSRRSIRERDVATSLPTSQKSFAICSAGELSQLHVVHLRQGLEQIERRQLTRTAPHRPRRGFG
ncbi:hypothetical protein A5695_07525 [Mycobacterium sp. E1747]|nr:hypothetical protein A5695_07525 [Mycobacterium sp. E1747]